MKEVSIFGERSECIKCDGEGSAYDILSCLKLGVNDIAVLDLPFHLCDALFDIFLLLVIKLGDSVGHGVKVGFNILQRLFVGDDSRAENCKAA
eukprot:461648-Ditylum_brightwellii.AAC.1